jgi:hypothetical protein
MPLWTGSPAAAISTQISGASAING